MTGDDTFACRRLRDSAAEVALGVLPAQERAAALAHLQRCPACRENVRELARTADELLHLIPGLEPPEGFETRVLQRIGLSPRRRRRTLRQRFALGLAAAVAAATLAVGGWAIGVTSASPPSDTGPARPDRLLSAGLTSHSQDVGRVFAYTGRPHWLYVSVDADNLPARARAALHGTLTCQIERADGSTTTIGTFSLAAGYAQWVTPYPAGSSPVTKVHLLAADRSVVADATLHPSD
ncbi:hypothetical protein DIZ27_05015 [Streptomyces sp. NWU339]|uniref:hypothetical protein n=1 Tax=Streptomyces sp. NWU339 TaxID=2185284 RepID=UPI000D682BEB|nr:hypothetical protein [Streptomyces sp. NWU339]PWI11411.1 hypothetical protein DIZ27_05015 [Streptomyces sp. NWU339]